MTRVRLRHASGAEVARIAHHAVAGIDHNAEMLDTLVPVLGSGDFNTTSLRAKLAAA